MSELDIKKINNSRILDLMSAIEDKTSKMFHEYNADLDTACMNALDGKSNASFIINKLSKILDDVSK